MIHNLRGSAGSNAVGPFPVKRPLYARFTGFKRSKGREGEDVTCLVRSCVHLKGRFREDYDLPRELGHDSSKGVAADLES
jgi:hypothetical protein